MERNRQVQRRSARIRNKTNKTKLKRPAPPPKKQKQKQKRQKVGQTAKAKPTGPGRKRKREEGPEPEPRRSKRNKVSTVKPRSPSPETRDEYDSSVQGYEMRIQNGKRHSILYWVQNGIWPDYLFQADPDKCPEDLISSREETTIEPSEDVKLQADELETYLNSKGSFLTEYEKGITKYDMIMCAKLLNRKCDIPKGTMFDDDGSFKYVNRILPERNATAIAQVIGRLVVPWAEIEIVRGQVGFWYLVDGIKELWDSSMPLNESLLGQQPDRGTGEEYQVSTPEPDYAVGFVKDAFTEEQLIRLGSFMGKHNGSSPFKSMVDMFFPFLTVEVKRNKPSLGLADRQNAHSMTRALRGVIDLFRLVNREKELNRKILGFSVSHDHENVKIYGHYPVICKDKTAYYCYPVREFSITARNGRERWTSYKFVMALYNDWVPMHFQRLSSAVDDLPVGVNFEVSLKSLGDLSAPCNDLPIPSTKSQ